MRDETESPKRKSPELALRELQREVKQTRDGFPIHPDGRVISKDQEIVLARLDMKKWEKTGLPFSDLHLDFSKPDGFMLSSATADEMDRMGRVLRANPQAVSEMHDHSIIQGLLSDFNARNPSVKARYAFSPKNAYQWAIASLSMASPGNKVRFMTYLRDQKHTRALEFRRKENGKISVVGVDSKAMPDARSSRRMENMLKREHPEIDSVVIFHTGAQIDETSGNSFTFEALKAFDSHPEKFDPYHGISSPHAIIHSEKQSLEMLPRTLINYSQPMELRDHPRDTPHPRVSRKGESLVDGSDRKTGKPFGYHEVMSADLQGIMANKRANLYEKTSTRIRVALRHVDTTFLEPTNHADSFSESLIKQWPKRK